MEFNKIKQQRVVTLVRIHLQKRNKVITQKSKQILVYVCNSKPIKYTSVFIIIAFVMGRYLAASALAVDANQNPTSRLLEQPGTSVSINPAPKPSPTLTTPKKPRKPRTTVIAPYYNPENISANNFTDQSEIKKEGRECFLQIEKKRKEKLKLAN